MIKNIIIVIETICMIALLAVCINFYNRLPGEVKSNELKNFQEVQEIGDEKTNNQVAQNYLAEENQITQKPFDANKMKVKMDDSIYENVRYDSLEGITIILEQDGKATVSVMADNEVYKSLYPDTETQIQNKELTGFDGKIASVYFAYFGNGIEPAKILFLLEDGSVEYIDSEKMIKNKDQKYVSEGKIESLANIVRFEDVAIGFENEEGEREGGSITVVAIDENGYGYDLEKLIKNEEEE